jgi:hypothetical protein
LKIGPFFLFIVQTKDKDQTKYFARMSAALLSKAKTKASDEALKAFAGRLFPHLI